VTGLAAHPANAPLLEYLDSRDAQCHPDLALRLGEIAADLDAQPSSTDGVAVLARHGIAFSFATGMSLLAFRVSEDVRAEVLDAPGTGRKYLADLHELNLKLAEELGADWVAADPWPIDAPRDSGLVQLRAWVRAAFAYVDSLS
jgi:hypothetical protein